MHRDRVVSRIKGTAKKIEKRKWKIMYEGFINKFTATPKLKT